MAKTTELVEVAIDDLQPYEKNAKTHPPAQLDKIRASIREFGFVSPCLIDRQNHIIAGHGRVKAAKSLGMKMVPCVYVEGLTDEQRRAYVLADNRLTELGGWDMDLVRDELESLDDAGLDISIIGFDWDTAAALPEIKEDEYQPESEEAQELPPRAKPGDVWQLGDHRLVCGDSTDPEAMDLLFDGQEPVMVFTDPPYGVAIGTKNEFLQEIQPYNRITENIEGDTMAAEDLIPMLTKAFALLKSHAADFCSYYVSAPTGGELGKAMLEMMENAGLPVRHTLIWVKSSATYSFSRLDYNYRHEPIYYTWSKSHRFHGGYDQTVIEELEPRLEHLEKPELKELVHALRGDGSGSVIYCDKTLKNNLHPTMKPVRLVARFIYNSSEEGDVVADIFGGSGTTMIAAEQLGRKCYMMELDPHYCDVILDRWEQYTGREATLVHG